ncbi:hypothetical protein BO70DRAFT_366713 [Aspergillus heteromorphus CBS 117.55]|uniref:Uncharacterized protein n=1 Tax=Aspergillus heteromorphus CBS 117.55 TaxID=1448321 RepID=A0A317UW00_9EURO|nr:uncharacterized protein BO70DRAFT_366713 [Aspergillus heteromorphus CBS 117.55]PWY65589.1 hypothetical protein BO70DRAFT_366713 [Aspergillus heteromorphus CBS 117.55]
MRNSKSEGRFTGCFAPGSPAPSSSSSPSLFLPLPLPPLHLPIFPSFHLPIGSSAHLPNCPPTQSQTSSVPADPFPDPPFVGCDPLKQSAETHGWLLLPVEPPRYTGLCTTTACQITAPSWLSLLIASKMLSGALTRPDRMA